MPTGTIIAIVFTALAAVLILVALGLVVDTSAPAGVAPKRRTSATRPPNSPTK